MNKINSGGRCFIGRGLVLKTGSKKYKVKVVSRVARIPSEDMFKCVDERGVDYLFTIYHGIHTIYSVGLFSDGLYGTRTCKIKLNAKEILRNIIGWIK